MSPLSQWARGLIVALLIGSFVVGCASGKASPPRGEQAARLIEVKVKDQVVNGPLYLPSDPQTVNCWPYSDERVDCEISSNTFFQSQRVTFELRGDQWQMSGDTPGGETFDIP